MTQTTTEQPPRSAPPTAALPVPDPGKERRSGGIVPVLAFCGIVVAVMQTLLVPVIKDLPTLLGTAPSNATWVLTATLLSGAVATPIMGRLGDLSGKRKMLLASLAVMVVGSLICGFTDNLIVMIVGRALQGFAMGAIPLGIGIMRDELPKERLGSAMALMSSSIGVGGGLALPVAALVAQHADWHALFFLAAGLGVLSMLLALLVVPETAVRAPGRFDLLGALGLSAGLIALLLPITKGSDWGWGSPTTLGLFGLALLILVLWGVMELRLADPLVDLRTSARREVLLTNLASITVGVAFYAISLVLPQVLQLPASTGYGLGQPMVIAGLCVAPLGLTMMLVAPVYARLAARRGPKVTLLLGMLIIGVGYGAGIGLMNAPWQTVIIAVVVGAGIGLAYSSLPALIIGAVDPSETGAANGLNTLMRSIGTSVSSAVIGMVLAHMSTTRGPVTYPTMAGFRTSFVIATGAVLLGVVFAAFLPAQRRAARPTLVAGNTEGEPETAGAGTAGLTVERADAAARAGVRGGIRTAAGAPVAGASVTLIDRRGRQAGVTTTDAAGRFALPDPGAGSYVLTGAAPGHTPHALALSCGGAPVDVLLTLTGAARLTGTLSGGARGAALAGGGVVVTDAEGAVVGRATTGADGRWEIRELPCTLCTVAFSAPGHRPEARTVDLADTSGATGCEEIRLLPVASVRGTVRGPGGAPLADAAVTVLTDGTVAGHTVTGPDGAFAFDGLTGGDLTLTASGYPPRATPISLTAGGHRTLDVDLVQPSSDESGRTGGA
ncbi:MFS transporter [Streptomyces catenulae]|uniref:MFS transporter n=1 Tax=Streptomyces catenulae TaxID=66875 RepID=A0ABV2Z2B1_9ACTN|nr:MFS transporter [Streptomyces catenulae]